MATRDPNNDVYNRQINFGAPISSDNVALTIPALSAALQRCTGKATGLLVQSMSVSYAQSNNNLFDVSSTDIIRVVGRTQGQMQLNRVIGRNSVAEFFYEEFGDACKIIKPDGTPNAIVLEFRKGRCSTGVGADNVQGIAVSYTAFYASIQNTTISVTAQDSIVNEAFAMTFSKLTKSKEDCVAAPLAG